MGAVLCFALYSMGSFRTGETSTVYKGAKFHIDSSMLVP